MDSQTFRRGGRRLGFLIAMFVGWASGGALTAQTVWFKRIVPVTSELTSVAYENGVYSAVALGRPKVLQSRDGRFWTASPLPDVINQVISYKGMLYGVVGGGNLDDLPYAISSGVGSRFEIRSEMASSQEINTFLNNLGDPEFRKVPRLRSASASSAGFVFLGRGPQVGDQEGVRTALYYNTNPSESSAWRVKVVEFPSASSGDSRFFKADGVVVGASKVLIFSNSNSDVPEMGGVSRIWYNSFPPADPPQGTPTTWKEIYLAQNEEIGDVVSAAYAGGSFVLVGKGGRIFSVSETDMKIERRSPNLTTASLNSVAYGNGRWVAVGACGTVAYSLFSDARTWQLAPTRVLDDLNAVTFGGGSFLAVGEGGVIIQSPN